MSVEVRVDPSRITRLLRLRGSRAERKLSDRTAQVARIAQREAPGRTGEWITWKVIDGPRASRA